MKIIGQPNTEYTYTEYRDLILDLYHVNHKLYIYTQCHCQRLTMTHDIVVRWPCVQRYTIISECHSDV